MMGAAGMLGGAGGGGYSASSSATATSGVDQTLDFGGFRFGDISTGGGFKIKPLTLGILAAAVIAGLWVWKH